MAVIAFATPTAGLVVVEWRDRWLVLHVESGKAVLGASFPTLAAAMEFAERAGEGNDWCVPDWSWMQSFGVDALADAVITSGGDFSVGQGMPSLTGSSATAS